MSKYKDIQNLSKQSLKRRYKSVDKNFAPVNRLPITNTHTPEFEYPEITCLSCSDIQDGALEEEYQKLVLSDESVDETENNDINDFLRSWVSDCNVPQMHVNKLIKYLKNNGHPTLPTDCRTLMRTPIKRNIIPMSPGSYVHIGLENGLQHYFEKFNVNEHELREIVLDFNIDGLPLSKSSSNCFWLILCRIVNGKKPFVFVVGIYNGYNKPNSFEEFLDPFVNELIGLNYEYTFNNKTIKLKIRAFVCDAPARASITGTKGHNAYYGCGKCTIEGEYIDNRVAFIGSGIPRTNDSFRQHLDEDHHNFTTPLEKLNIDMIKAFPHDYLHVVLLGVVRKMLRMWSSGKTFSLLPNKAIKEISKRLEFISKTQPKEFQRKTRKLSELNYYKGTELRTFLLYSGPFVLKDILDKVKYEHFMLLHNAILILCGETFEKYLDVAQKMLVKFVHDFAIIYGKQNISFNVHSLLHITDDVKLYGKLDSYSAFQFESYMHSIKRLLQKKHQCLSQLSNRIIEMYQQTSEINSVKHSFPILKQKKTRNNQKIYTAIETKNFKISDTVRNKWIMSDKCEIIEFEYATENNEGVHVFGTKLLTNRSFYKTPIESRIFDIYESSSNQSELLSWNIKNISKKFFMMENEINNEKVFFPLLHSSV